LSVIGLLTHRFFFKRAGIIVFKTPKSLHWMHTHILLQGKFKPVDEHTNPDEYAQHLKDKYGNGFLTGYFLKDQPFANLHAYTMQ
jgi:hypothetical protein